MVSLALCFLNSVSKLIPKPHRSYSHAYNIPFPQVLHKHLDASFIEQFEEVFVIGDVHGCYDELKKLLEVSNTTNDRVLKIFVGDLVNKGPKNLEVLSLVRESKSMLSVRGNHDEIVLREYFDHRNPEYKLKDKNLWIRDLGEENMKYLVELPYTISIPSLNSIIVHAGLVPGVPLEINDPMDMVHVRNIVVADYFWEGGLMATDDTTKGEPWAQLWGGPQHVYFGHDAKRMLQKCFRATGLDTGCVYGNYLTGQFIYGPRKGQMVHVKAAKAYGETKGQRIVCTLE